MGTQEEPAPPAVTLADVLAVLELTRGGHGVTTPVPTSWEATLARVRAVLVAPAGKQGPGWEGSQGRGGEESGGGGGG